MPERVVSLERILAAREAVSGRVHRTPMMSSATAARVVGLNGGPRLANDRLFVKAEHQQLTGSFKPRGALTRILALSPRDRERGIVTFSAGNASQGFAWAGRETAVHPVVVMPVAAVPSKVEACRGYGAEVVLHGTHVGETLARVSELVEDRGLLFCHPFDDPDVIAGYGTVGLEILEDLPDVDVVVAGIGGGGLISGVAAALKERRPGVRVYGIEPVESNALSLGLERGEPVPIHPHTVADGLGAPFAGDWTLAMCARYVDGIELLDDPTILAGVRFAAERLKQVLEPAGAAALAAVLFGRIPIRDGERVCVVASGGNVELAQLGAFFEQAAPLPA